jgi:hypothetical protein
MANRGAYVSLVGQRRKKQFTARQVAAAGRRTGILSKGLSGRGKAPAIHWLESGTKPHRIKKSGSGLLWWNIGKGGYYHSPRAAKQVRHTGHKGTGFLSKVEKTHRLGRIRRIRSEINLETRRLGYR